MRIKAFGPFPFIFFREEVTRMSKRGRPTSNNSKDVTIKVRLTRKELGRLRTLADEKEISMSAMIRLLINEYWSIT